MIAVIAIIFGLGVFLSISVFIERRKSSAYNHKCQLIDRICNDNCCLNNYVFHLMPVSILSVFYHRKCQKIGNQLLSYIILIRQSLKSGDSLRYAMMNDVKCIELPLQYELVQIQKKLSNGEQLLHAIEQLHERWPHPYIKQFVLSMRMIQSIGGNIIALFDGMIIMITQQKRLREKKKTILAQAKFQSSVLLSLPLVLAAALYLVDDTYFDPLLQPLGVFIIVISLSLEAVGAYFLYRIMSD